MFKRKENEEKGREKTDLRNYVVYITFVSIFVLFTVMFGGKGFISLTNLLNITMQTALYSLMSFGLVFVFAAGMNDLSIAATMALSGLVVAFVFRFSSNVLLALAMGVGVGLIIGVINGLLVTVARLPYYLATIGMQYLVRGMAMRLTDTDFAVPIENETFIQIFGQGRILGLPVLFLWTILFFMLTYLLMYKCRFGSHTMAVGGNETAAQYSGINTGNVKKTAFIISSVMASIAGIMFAARIQSARYTFGEGAEFSVIAAVVLGGTAMKGGNARIFGAFVGSLLMGMIDNGLIMAGLSISQQMLIRGAIILMAIVLGNKDKIDSGSKQRNIFKIKLFKQKIRLK